MAKANYHVVGNRVFAKVAKLTEEELAAVKNYILLGYELVDSKEKEKKPINELFTAKAIQSYLEEKGTKEQQKIYWEKFNSPVIDKNTGEQKKYKNGKAKVKGHIATLQWFKTEFPNYGK